MTSPELRHRKVALISNRELFVCDNVVDMKVVTQIGMMVKTLHYLRKEKSRPGVPGLIAVSDIPTDRVATDRFSSRFKTGGPPAVPRRTVFRPACLCQLQHLWG